MTFSEIFSSPFKSFRVVSILSKFSPSHGLLFDIKYYVLNDLDKPENVRSCRLQPYNGCNGHNG